MAPNLKQKLRHAIFSRKVQMKYRLEFYPNRNMMSVHVDRRVSTESLYFGGEFALGKSIEEALRSGPSIVKGILGLRGVVGIDLKGYNIRLEKAEVFKWEDILDKALVIINVELDPNGQLEKVAEDKKPSQKYLRALERQACDIDEDWMRQCPDDEL